MAKYYAIDLGTSNTCVAVYDSSTDQTTVLKPIGQGDTSLVPSVVFYKSASDILVGKTAKKRGFDNKIKQGQVFKNFKPEMGTETSWRLFDKDITPVCLSSEILKNIKEVAGLVGHTIESAVITCPATFGVKERAAIIESAAQAGISVDPSYGLVDEPSAAAYDYLLEKNLNLIIVDLGGGTLDISLMECHIDDDSDFFKYTPINNGGRKTLGGRDWDSELVKIINKAIAKLPLECRNHLSGEQLMQDDLLQKAIAYEVESIKSNLSDMDSCEFGYFKDDYDIELKITRSEFEKATKPLCDQLLTYLQETLDQHPEFIADRLLLVGGATLMPQIRKGIENNFDSYKDKIFFHNEPFYSVARGAAKYKHLVENGAIVNRLYDSYGFGLANETLPREIKNNTFINNFFFKGEILQADPILKSQVIAIQTTQEDQTLLSLGIYQNPSKEQTIPFSGGQKIGTVHIELPEKLPKGSVFNICFFIDTNKLLSLEATEDKSNPIKLNQKLNATIKL